MNSPALTRPEVIVFDWDGTLVDSASDIVGAMRQASLTLGIEPPPEERMRRAIGLGLVEAFHQIFSEHSEPERQQLMERYRAHYINLPPQVHGKAFASVPDMLHDLHRRGNTLAVATGKSRAGLQRSLGANDWGQLFRETRCADESASKPHPLMLEQLSLRLCAEPETMLMVGDTTYDMEMARNFGCRAVGVAWGVHEADELRDAGAEVVFSDLGELPVWIDTVHGS